MSLERRFWVLGAAVIAVVMLCVVGLLGWEVKQVREDAERRLVESPFVTVTSSQIITLTAVEERVAADSTIIKVDENTLIENDGTEFYRHDIGTLEQSLIATTTSEPTSVGPAGAGRFGYITPEVVGDDFSSKLSFVDISTGVTVEARTNSGEAFDVLSWAAVSENQVMVQENGTYLMYLYDLNTGTSSLVGKFDTIGGAAGPDQVWFYDAVSNKDISLYNTVTGSTTVLDFPGPKGSIITQISTLPDGSVVWRYTGVKDDPDQNTQTVIIQNPAGYTRTVFSSLQVEQQFVNPIQFNDDGSLLAVSVSTNSTPQIIIIDAQSGVIVEELSGRLLWFQSAL
jgi:hypothetical protein